MSTDILLFTSKYATYCLKNLHWLVQLRRIDVKFRLNSNRQEEEKLKAVRYCMITQMAFVDIVYTQTKPHCFDDVLFSF